MVIEDYISKEPIINDPSSAMTKKQRKKIVCKVAEELQENDEVVKQCLQDKQYTATGKMFFIGNSDVASSLSSDARFEQAKITDNVVKLQGTKKLEPAAIGHPFHKN